MGLYAKGHAMKFAHPRLCPKVLPAPDCGSSWRNELTVCLANSGILRFLLKAGRSRCAIALTRHRNQAGMERCVSF